MYKLYRKTGCAYRKVIKLDNKDKFYFMQETLDYMRENHLYRSTREFSSAQSKYVTLNGKRLLMFASNSYLDLCNNKEIKDFVKDNIDAYGIGSGGSRLTTGSSLLTEQLENTIAEFKNTESAIIFNTGYMANVGTISAVCNKEWVIFSDELNHASIIDGCRLSKAKIIVYKHNDMIDLESKILENPCKKGLIVSDGVFSMDGDIVNLPELIRLADKYNLLSMIDDAHATGVIGKSGRGTSEYYNMSKGADITLGTLSKALGSEGGYVCGSKILTEYLKNKSRAYIFSTAMSPATVAASIKAIDIISKNPNYTLQLQDNVKFFCNALKSNGINAYSETAIIPIIIGDEQKALDISNALFKEGIYISAIRYPTVAKGSARLRAALMSSHTKEELQFAADKISEIIRKAQ